MQFNLKPCPRPEGQSFFCIYILILPHSVIMTLSPLTSCHWDSTWNLRTGHIRSYVLSKIYDRVWYGRRCRSEVGAEGSGGEEGAEGSGGAEALLCDIKSLNYTLH